MGVIFKHTMPCQPPPSVTRSMQEYVLGADCSSTDLAVTSFYSLKYLHFVCKGSFLHWNILGYFIVSKHNYGG